MGANLARVLESLTTLSSDDLDVVSQRINMLKAAGGESAASALDRIKSTTVRVSDGYADQALDAVVGVARARGFDNTPAAVLRKSKHWTMFRTNMLVLTQFINLAAKSRIERDVFLSLCFELLADDLKKWYRPAITTRTLMVMSLRIPSVVYRAFPGYVETGMIRMVIERKRHAKTPR